MKLNHFAIIGGGPIGLYSAILLSREGYWVDVYEKSTWPRDKVCGQGIMPQGVNLLQEIGVDFKNLESFNFKGISYIDEDFHVQGELASYGKGVERKLLSQSLYELAKKEGKINFYDRQQIIGITSLENKVIIKNHENKEYSYPYVFSCDGLNSNIRRLLKLEKGRRDKGRMGARVHFYISPWTQNVEVYWSDGVEAYVTPVSDSKVEVAFLWYKDKVPQISHLKNHLLKKFPRLLEKLQGTSCSSDFKAYGPFVKVSKKIQHNRVFFLGDAYKFLDGITGEGISIGLRTSKYVIGNFMHFNLLHSLRVKTTYLKYSLMVKFALTLSRYTWFRRLIFRMVGKRQRIFDGLLRLNEL